jgi:hypothetical protein
MKTLTLVTNYDDWEGLYLDGEMIEQGHKINWEDVLSYLNFNLETKEADYDWLADEGALPEKIEDCKFAVED